jgi:hypothetical protein
MQEIVTLRAWRSIRLRGYYVTQRTLTPAELQWGCTSHPDCFAELHALRSCKPVAMDLKPRQAPLSRGKPTLLVLHHFQRGGENTHASVGGAALPDLTQLRVIPELDSERSQRA